MRDCSLRRAERSGIQLDSRSPIGGGRRSFVYERSFFLPNDDLRVVVEVAGSATYGDIVAVIKHDGQQVVVLLEQTPRGPESPYMEFALKHAGEKARVICADTVADVLVDVLSVEDVDRIRRELDTRIGLLEWKSEGRKRYNALFSDFLEEEVYTLVPLIEWHKNLLRNLEWRLKEAIAIVS